MIAAGQAGVPLVSVGRFTGESVKIGAFRSSHYAELTETFRQQLCGGCGLIPTGRLLVPNPEILRAATGRRISRLKIRSSHLARPAFHRSTSWERLTGVNLHADERPRD